MRVLPMLKINSLPSICSLRCKNEVTRCRANNLLMAVSQRYRCFHILEYTCPAWWHSCKFQCGKHKNHLAFCQSCQYFINLQLRQSITKHFTNHCKTTISCPTPGLEIIQHASQRPREVCKQPGIKTGVARRTHTVCVSYRNRMERNAEKDATC